MNDKNKQRKKGFKISDIIYISVFAVIITVCSWISVPGPIPFTLQTFGIFCTAGFLGGKRAAVSVAVYIALGAVGVPVFSGFRGGAYTLIGTTGGYIWGFLLSMLIYQVITGILRDCFAVRFFAMLLGLAVCYISGTAWYLFIYADSATVEMIPAVLAKCVLPFIIPDIIKIFLALAVVKAIPNSVKRNI